MLKPGVGDPVEEKGRQMSRTSLVIALMTAAALVVFIIASAGPAAAARTDICSEQIAQCFARGSEFCRNSQNEASCLAGNERKCFKAFNKCASQVPLQGSAKTTNVPSTNPTGTPPKGGLEPITGGVVTQPGGGGSSPTKPKGGLEPINSGSTQQSGSGDGSGSGTTTIYRTHGKR